MLDPPNLKPWAQCAGPATLYSQAVFGLPTAFQNDANAAAFGEFWVGVGRDVHSMVLFTLGTGVGGGIVIGGVVVEGEHSHGALELGHMKIEMTNPRQCGCGRWGCLEAYASRHGRGKTDPGSPGPTGCTLVPVQSNHQGGGNYCTRYFRRRGRRRCAGGNARWKILAFYFWAVGVTNVLHTIDPDMVVFAGGMVAAGPAFLERIRKHVRQLAFPVPAEKAMVCYAQLGSDAGFIGRGAGKCGQARCNKSAKDGG